MENDTIVAALAAAERSFEQTPKNIEEGLDVEDAELVQLRRACRLLATASRLLEEGFYTVVIESSFVAIERTIQFRCIHDGAISGSEVISSHRRLYQRGAEVGLYDETFADELAELWVQDRTETYYRLGVATEAQAAAMWDLAREIHRYLVDGSQIAYECIC